MLVKLKKKITSYPIRVERTRLPNQSGYWNVTSEDRKIKAKCTNNVIGTKKTLVFYKGRVHGGVRINWVMREYHPCVTLPH